MNFHPIAELFPLMQGGAFEELAADICAHGLQEAIWLYEGQILDGRNRWRACQVAGVEPVFKDYTGTDPLGFVVSLNLKRRHLTESQRAMVGARLANMKAGDNQHKTASGQDNCPDLSKKDAANILNVSDKSIQRAKKVQMDGIKELGRKVESGELRVSVAADIAGLPEEEQVEVLGKASERLVLQVAKEIRGRREESGLPQQQEYFY